MNAQELFGKRIKELRKQNKLTQEELSEMLGVFPKQVGNIETGTTFTTMNNIEKLAKVLNVEIEDLFTFSQQKERHDLVVEINNMLNKATDDKLRIIYKIIKAVVI